MMTKEEIGKRIKLHRQHYTNLTTEQVAKQVGVSRVTYSKMERGLQNTSIPMLSKLADLFGFTLSNFLESDTSTLNNKIQELSSCCGDIEEDLEKLRQSVLKKEALFENKYSALRLYRDIKKLCEEDNT